MKKMLEAKFKKLLLHLEYNVAERGDGSELFHELLVDAGKVNQLLSYKI